MGIEKAPAVKGVTAGVNLIGVGDFISGTLKSFIIYK